MTGFARQEVTYDWGTLTWEIRSVNHRFLEPHFRLPEIFRAIEPELRTRLRKALSRGKVEIALYYHTNTAKPQAISINEELLCNLADALRQVDAAITCNPANPVEVLQWPGIVNSATTDQEQLHATALELFDTTIKSLGEFRLREGKELGHLITQRLDAIDTAVEGVRSLIPAILSNHRAKLTERIAAIKEDINPERLEQELVIFAQKADVDEELDRLITHVSEVRRTLKQKSPIGRRLDFLMQELNREANTLSSKSVAVDTTQTAIELKILIEQMREQIQNIE
ncbi:YicC/YloC family endoribonuclease [Aurantivibrio plasticivorans]